MTAGWKAKVHRLFWGAVKVSVSIYIGLLGAMYFNQRQLEYFPVTASAGSPKENGVPEMNVIVTETADGLPLQAWFAPPKNKNGKVIVLFHGNASNLGPKAQKARVLLDHGYGVYMCEYRGFGGNPGQPTEEGVYNDARAAFAWLEKKGFTASQMIIYGESIGSGVAVQMALERQPAILILEAPFTSAEAVAAAHYPIFPVSYLMHDRFESIDKIGKVHSSLLIVHGDHDDFIPMAFGRKLYEAANEPKKFVSVQGGGHADLYDFGAGAIIANWLDEQVKAEKKAG